MKILSDKITVCLFAYNEAGRLERSLANFAGLMDVLVVDNCSTDATREVAGRLGVRCVTIGNPGFIETPEVMDPLWRAVGTDYILIASCSEFVPFELLRRYAQIAETDSHDVARAYRVSITAGLPIPISGLPGRGNPGELRFFKRGAVSYVGNTVHGRGQICCAADRVLSLVHDSRCHYYQFRDYDVSWTERKHGGYNDVLAYQRYKDGARFSWFKMIFESLKEFGNAYFRFGACRYGMLGFIHSFYRLQMAIGIWLRIWEWEHGYERAKVIENNGLFRREEEQRFERERSK
ncbi:glycosyltransferase [Hydrocarboniphaga sp.]|uniref:glycosyltransferase n=1 Tax=Hydrocarboniphaga sp. TaxID=2033016 RepID=UPI003D0B2A0B